MLNFFNLITFFNFGENKRITTARYQSELSSAHLNHEATILTTILPPLPKSDKVWRLFSLIFHQFIFFQFYNSP